MLQIEIYDENALADPFTGLDPKLFDVYYIDGLKQRHIVTDKCTIEQKCGGTFSMSGVSRFTTTIFAAYYDENTDTTFECNYSGILTCGNINSVSVQKDENTGQYGVKFDADLQDDYIYEVNVRVYDCETHYISLGGNRKELEKKGALLGSFSTDATEFLIDDTILPTQKTKFYVYVNIVISSKDGTQCVETPVYYVLYKV